MSCKLTIRDWIFVSHCIFTSVLLCCMNHVLAQNDRFMAKNLQICACTFPPEVSLLYIA